MLKEMVEYEAFDGSTKTKTLYFNLTTSRLAKNFDVKVELEDIQTEIIDGEQRELEPHEIKRIFDLVERLIELSYGVLSADGEEFDQSKEVFTRFQNTAAYDRFLMTLFEDTKKATAWMMGVMPRKLREEVENSPEGKAALASLEEQKENPELKAAPPVLEGNEEDTRPAWIKEGRAPSAKELVGATQEEIQLAMQFQSQQKS